MIWRIITDFGDSATLLPAAGLLLVWLAANRAWRMVGPFCLCLPISMALVVASKIAFIAWGLGIETLDFTGISGHSMLSTAILPLALYSVFARRSTLTAELGALAGMVLGIVIGLSRLALHCHSESEVIAGCLLGGATAATVLYLGGTDVRLRTSLPTPLLAAALLLALSVSHGQRAPSEVAITRLALAVSGHTTPHVRAHPPGYGAIVALHAPRA